jgi:hypothetical protein
MNRPSASLCETCRWARIVPGRRGAVFYLCRLAATDGRFEKYPQLPVLCCAGHEPATVEDAVQGE